MESPGAERMIARRYRLSRTLGQGGMGVVWEGYDTLLDRPVAVKEVIFPPEIAPAERQNLVIRTIREARAAARLNHSAIVSIYDVAEEDGRPWIVMELIRAMPLDEMVRTYGATPIRQVADIGCQMLSALRAAHAAGIVHRDVKPGNILVREDGTAVLTDFGLATVEGDASLTQVGTVAGSPAFMAPERVRGEKAGPASDLWALGATLYAAVMGRSPFERGDTMATMNAILEEEPDLSRMPRVLHPVLRGLMARDPEQRLTADQAEEMLAVLGTPPPRDPALRRLSRAVAQRMPGLSGRGRRALVVGGAVTTVAVLATVGWVTLGPRTPASLTADAASRATGRTATTAGTVTSEPRTPVPATPAATADARPTPTPTRTAAPGRALGAARVELAPRLVHPVSPGVEAVAAAVLHRLAAPGRGRPPRCRRALRGGRRPDDPAARGPGRLRGTPRAHDPHAHRAVPGRRRRRVGVRLGRGRVGAPALGASRPGLPRAAARRRGRRPRLRRGVDDAQA